jgi:hypothetical protein
LAEVTGFEPVITISKTAALDQPKLYPNKNMVGVVGIEPTLSESKSDMLPLHNTPTKTWRPHMESNHNPRLRRPVYYPLYYAGKLNL